LERQARRDCAEVDGDLASGPEAHARTVLRGESGNAEAEVEVAERRVPEHDGRGRGPADDPGHEVRATHDGVVTERTDGHPVVVGPCRPDRRRVGGTVL